MKFVAISAALLACFALAFGAGMLFQKHRLLGSSYVSTKPLALAGRTANESGILPSGTTLYSYGGPDEQPLFVVFLGTKELGSLEPSMSQHWLEISPLVASSASTTR